MADVKKEHELITTNADEINQEKIITEPKENIKTETENFIQNNGNEPTLNQDEQNPPSNKQESGVCGNNICEPDRGETKEICPKDCSAGD